MAQIFLITGTNRGIGLALTRELLGLGHTVVAAARNPRESTELRELELVHGPAITLLKMDVNDDASVIGAANELRRHLPALDCVINNAAVFPEEGTELLAEMDLDFFREAFETNVLGVVRVSRAFLPMLEQGADPRLINISSGAGSILHKRDSNYYAYSVSKAALNMLTRAMAAEFKARGICVVALTPGWVRTAMGGQEAPLSPEQSARCIASTAVELRIEQSDSFLDRNGLPTDW